MTNLPKTYNPTETEEKIYKLWEKSGFFNPDKLPEQHKTPYSIVLPPPNVTGVLHMGSALMLAIQDIMIRFERMRGKKTLWLPGTDHAAIATETKFLKEKKISRRDYEGKREEFVKLVDEFARGNQHVILDQMRAMGSSLDWSRLKYTLDEEQSAAVREAFAHMWNVGIIYRAEKVINWDSKGQTAVSDDEIEYETRQTTLYTFHYSRDFPIAISTTRPETKVGDTAVAVHPSDVRYKQYIGKEIHVEDFVGVKLDIKIVGDASVDPAFGTGALGVTPAHSKIDEAIAQRHGLPARQVINELDRMNEQAGSVSGQKTAEAREHIVQWLRENKLLEKEEVIEHNFPKAQRSGGLIEQLPKRHQLFVNVNKPIPERNNKTLKELMREPIADGRIKILPERFEKIYFHWIDNLRDWNISRQIWYGHQVPLWYCGGSKKSSVKKLGFHKTIIPELLGGKTRTYRIHDHGLKVGDEIVFENSGLRLLVGRGAITNVQKTTVGDIALPDMKHSGKYKTTSELIDAFKRMHPTEIITVQTPAFIYDYEFTSFEKQKPGDGCGQIIASSSVPDACPVCGGSDFEQETDTLDTWFSSGLWTFSTLGWPKETSDLKTFHPTDVLETAYDILFFWVARMILMSQFLLGDIPFKTVYLHGLVRDEKGRKISKSLGNNIDPLVMIDQYGADAVRMAMIIGTSVGNDSKVSPEKFKAYKHFANKLWNIARYLIEKGDVTSNAPLMQKYIDEFHALVKEVTEDMESFRFYLAGEKLYHYVWHTFADKIIEESKDKMGTYTPTMNYILKNSLKLLHPFMPFVTEEIWSRLPKWDSKKMLIVESWPGSEDS